MPVAVEPERLLKDLRKLWAGLATEEANEVLRACAMTLIVAVEDSTAAASASETIAGLMHEHPSRAIVLRVRESGGQELEARVFAQCWMPFGRRQQICCEQVEITSSHASLADVPAVIRALIVPDLPVVLYCGSPSVCRAPGFGDLLPLADKLIVDSNQPGGVDLLPFLDNLRRGRPRAADLAWGRLTRWRETIARIFEQPALRRSAYDLESVQILYTGGENRQPRDTGERLAPSSVYYLAGWFMHVLGAGVHLNIAHGVGPSYASIARVDLVGPKMEATVEMTAPNTVQTRVAGVKQVSVFPEMTDCEALAQELSITSRDSIYEDVLGLANLMLGKQ